MLAGQNFAFLTETCFDVKQSEIRVTVLPVVNMTTSETINDSWKIK